jgi:hypothetical protein
MVTLNKLYIEPQFSGGKRCHGTARAATNYQDITCIHRSSHNASTGHIWTQAPQLTQVTLSMTSSLSSIIIASTGQTPMQVPQISHFLNSTSIILIPQ